MNDDKLKRLTDLAEKLYAEFLNNETICGLTSLFKKNKVGSKTGGYIRKILYQKYGKQNVDKISFKRTSVNSHKVRNKESYQHSEEWNENIRLGNKRSWSEDDGSRRETSKQSMIKNCWPKTQTEETKKKRVESRSWYKHSDETKEKISKGNVGKITSDDTKLKQSKAKKKNPVKYWLGKQRYDETLQKMSKATKQMWKNGLYKKFYQSKGHKEIIEVLKNLGYKPIKEYFVNGRPYDIYVKDKNLLIEFNGTFWHRDPRFDKYKNDPLSPSIWKNDLEKIDNAKDRGYAVKIIWQYDWENCQNKEEMIKSLLC